jgi:hypothetical protein
MKVIKTKVTPFGLLRQAAGNVHACVSRFCTLIEKPEDRLTHHAAIAESVRIAALNRFEAARVIGQSSFFWRDHGPAGRLIERLDRIPRKVEKAADRLRAYGMDRPPGEVLQLARCFDRMAEIVLRCMDPIEKDDSAGLLKAAAELRTAIDEVETVGIIAVSALFQGSGAPLVVLKGHDLYGLLGEVARCFLVVAEVVDDIGQRTS